MDWITGFYLSDLPSDTRVTGQLLEAARDSNPVLPLHPQPVSWGIGRLGQCYEPDDFSRVRSCVTSLCFEQAG